ncbi:MAG: DUF1048 domain-containing protein [Lachnospiraceae bacterium]
MRESYLLYKEKLQGEYFRTFDKIEVYCLTHMDEDRQEESLTELLDIFLNAQEEGKEVEKIIGNNLESFCENFCYGQEKNVILEVVRAIKRISWIVFLFSLIEMVLRYGLGDEPILAMNTDIVPIIIGVVCGSLWGLIARIMIKMNLFSSDKISMRKIDRCGIVVCFISGIVSGVMNSSFGWEIGIKVWQVMAVSGGYLIIYYLLRKIYDRKSKSVKQEKIKLWDFVIQDMPDAMNERYEKHNRKLVKKGKEPLTKEEFTQFLKKENKKGQKIDKYGWLIYIVIIGSGAVLVTLWGATWYDILIFLAVCTVCVSPLVFITGTGKKARKWLGETLKACEEQQTDIFTYMESLKYLKK